MMKNDIEIMFEKRKELSQNGDLKGLLELARYRWEKFACTAVHDKVLPEISFYYGKLQDIDGMSSFLDAYNYCFCHMSKKSLELSEMLFDIGLKYPNIDESELKYIEDLSCSPEYYDLMNTILFDSYLLPRTIKKYDLTTLQIKHSTFPSSLVNEVYDCFLKNERLDPDNEEIYVYNRATNSIVRKKYNKLDRIEFYITQIASLKIVLDISLKICGDDFFNFLKNRFEEYYGKKYNVYNDMFYLDRGISKTFDDSVVEYFGPRYNEYIDKIKNEISECWLIKTNEINLK